MQPGAGMDARLQINEEYKNIEIFGDVLEFYFDVLTQIRRPLAG